MFVDKAKIFIKSGDGGDGCVSFHTEKYVPNGGPNGGDGGKGGDIIFQVDNGKSSLIDFLYETKFVAGNGAKGATKNCSGKGGLDLVIKVPRGTVIKDFETGAIICDLFDEGAKKTVLKGGLGGKGNAKFATSTRQAPRFAQSGERTERRAVLLELLTIADAGLVGYPNVGKSTLLSVISAAKPKIANYPFTTLSPNLGVVKYYENNFTIADIPGLIEGAGEGKGLGLEFLRHIERTRLIVHLVDISESEGRNALDDYKTIRNELKIYSKKLTKLPEIVVLSKIDLLQDNAAVEQFKKQIRKKVYPICAITGEGIKELIDAIWNTLRQLPAPAPLEYEEFVFQGRDKSSFCVDIDSKGVFVVSGGFLESLARKVNFDDDDSLRYFHKMMREKGIIDELEKMGAVDGDTVRVLDMEFEFVK